MKNTFGNALTITLFGESHGDAVGCVIDGIAPGLPVDDEEIKKILSRRRPTGKTDTARSEKDEYKILSGVFNSHTTGTPICIVIPNEDTKSHDYERGPARPSHADLTAFIKYHGFEDHRGGGHFSGRVTAALCAASGIIMPALRNGGINIGSHIEKCCGIEDLGFSKDPVKTIELLKTKSFPTISDEAGEKMIKAIEDAKNEQDSVGGIIETCITGLPAGLGEPWFDSFEGILSHIVFSLGGVKGIEFGKGFGAAGMKGSEFNDPFVINDGKIKTTTNNNGGINGGITNGMDVLFRVAVKPTPSISKEQDTVNFLTKEAEKLVIRGRHDPAIVRRICPVIDAVTALAVADLLTVRFGTDALLEGSRLWNTD